jgi:hypothetical protein
MPTVISQEAAAPPPRLLVPATIAVAAALAGTVWLWGDFGETVFFETIRAGFVACFG